MEVIFLEVIVNLVVIENLMIVDEVERFDFLVDLNVIGGVNN